MAAKNHRLWWHCRFEQMVTTLVCSEPTLLASVDDFTWFYRDFKSYSRRKTWSLAFWLSAVLFWSTAWKLARKTKNDTCAARNESELEGRACLVRPPAKQTRARDPPLGSCTCRALGPVPILAQNGDRVLCKWRIPQQGSFRATQSPCLIFPLSCVFCTFIPVVFLVFFMCNDYIFILTSPQHQQNLT